MKKIVFAIVILGFILAMSSCDHVDSNDIDFIIPNDSTATGIVQTKL